MDWHVRSGSALIVVLVIAYCDPHFMAQSECGKVGKVRRRSGDQHATSVVPNERDYHSQQSDHRSRKQAVIESHL